VILPSRRTFRTLSRLKQWVPVAASIPLESEAQTLFEAVKASSPSILLESARTHPVTGRYSSIAGSPSEVLMAKGDQVQLQQGGKIRKLHTHPLKALQTCLAAKPTLRIKGLPPFVGGAVGFLGYDLYRSLSENVRSTPVSAVDDLNLPDLTFLFCDEAVVIDHLLKKLWVIVLAPPSERPDSAYAQAVARIDQQLERLKRSPDPVPSPAASFSASENRTRSTHTRSDFQAMVRQAKTFIADGEIYQANLSQRFSMALTADPWTLYRRLTEVNPSPFAAFADFPALGPWGGPLQIVSASPERFLRVTDQKVETRPIAGTRPRGHTAAETTRLRRELILNEKERAEHLMLVDLERNDLGRICRYGTVRVDDPMVLEEYSHVIHIVSNVSGLLKPQVQMKALIAATFPGGTISGCPKIRSLEIIDALEPVQRQLYTGALGYISYTGDMDLNLLIRTAFVTGTQAFVQVGAGIVADSDPGREYEETLHKGQALMETFDGNEQANLKQAGSLSGSTAG